MRLLKQISKETILRYISILLMIINTGSLIRSYAPRDTLLFYIGCCFILKIISRPPRNTSFYYIIYIAILMLITTIHNENLDNTFFTYILLGISTYWLIGSMEASTFKKIFLNITSFLSIISLLIFAISQFTNLPLEYKISENLVIGHFMYHTIEWNYSPLNRNAGIYTEPGGFQYCLNYTLLLFVEDIVCNNINKRIAFKLSLIVVTLITCNSTTGYLVLMLIITYIIFSIKSKYKILLFPIMLIIGGFLIFYLYNSETIKGKLSTKNENTSLIMRTADAEATIRMIKDNPILGNGGTSTKEYQRKVVNYGALTGTHGATNGILVPMAVLGIMWIFIFFYFSIKSCKRLYKRVPWWFIFILFLLVNTNEYFTFYPLTYIFIFKFKNYCQKRISNTQYLR